jgi:hypothetical protein
MHAPICRIQPRRSFLWTAASKALLKFGAPLALALVTAGPAFADGPAAPTPRPADQDQTGYRNAHPGSTDYPASDVHTAVDAHARTAFQRATYHRLQDSLGAAIRTAQYNFEHSPEYLEATDVEQRAWEDYLAARAEALKPVKRDPAYQTNVSLKHDMTDQIDEVRAAFDTHHARYPLVASLIEESKMQRIVALASVKLNYAQVATDMEVAALRGDSKVADTRAKLMAAGKRMREQRAALDRSIRTSQELAALREKIEDARIALITAEAFRDGAVEAAREALDYAYYKNRTSGGYGVNFEYGYSTGYRN